MEYFQECISRQLVRLALDMKLFLADHEAKFYEGIRDRHPLRQEQAASPAALDHAANLSGVKISTLLRDI